MQGLGSLRERIKPLFQEIGVGGALAGFLLLIILSLFLVQFPPFVLDLLLVVNLALTLTLLLRALFVDDPVRMFSFPTMLLMLTLYRLGLNVASTRLILTQGQEGHSSAGRVIQAFGEFVVQGNVWVGAIVFLVISLVNFLVISKGSGRVAEVAARFALDAMPGKQLAIDAELRAGSLTTEEADERRTALGRESQFYGAMDGAMKFVQGDAVAGLAIALLNLFGGIVLGMSRNLTFFQSVDTFGVLAVGDGLVSLLPSLFVSVCAGLVVTSVGGSRKRGPGAEMMIQFIEDPRALLFVGSSLVILSVVPGLPFWSFFGVGALLCFLAISPRAALMVSATSVSTSSGSATGYPRLPAPAGHALERGRDLSAGLDAKRIVRREVRLLSLAVSTAWSERVTRSGVPVLTSCIEAYEQLQTAVFAAKGVILPRVDIEPVLEGNSAYRVSLRERSKRTGEVPFDFVFGCVPPSLARMLGARVFGMGRHPIDQRMGVWFEPEPSLIASLRHLGIPFLESHEFIAAECVGTALEHCEEIFGVEQVQELVSFMRTDSKFLVEQAFAPGILTFAEFTDLMRRFVREGVEVRDVRLVLEAILECAAYAASPEDRIEWVDKLHEHIRRKLSGDLVARVTAASGRLRVFSLSPDIEEEFRGIGGDWLLEGGRPSLDPELESVMRRNAARLFAPAIERGLVPLALVVPADIRRSVQEFFFADGSPSEWLSVLSYEEVAKSPRVESVGIISA